MIFVPTPAILAILGDSKGSNIEEDKQILTNILTNAELTFLCEPNREEVNEKLWNNKWDILFFAGHSQTELETGRIYINSEDSLSLEELSYALKKAVNRGLKLAIFNSCDGLGLANFFEKLNLPQIIVMREPVPDIIAQQFLKYFLTDFSQGKHFYLAVREARERLQGLEGKYPGASWQPIIVQNPGIILPTWLSLMENIQTNQTETTPKNNIKTQNKTKKSRRKILKYGGFILGTIVLITLFQKILKQQPNKTVKYNLKFEIKPITKPQIIAAGEV